MPYYERSQCSSVHLSSALQTIVDLLSLVVLVALFCDITLTIFVLENPSNSRYQHLHASNNSIPSRQPRPPPAPNNHSPFPDLCPVWLQGASMQQFGNFQFLLGLLHASSTTLFLTPTIRIYGFHSEEYGFSLWRVWSGINLFFLYTTL